MRIRIFKEGLYRDAETILNNISLPQIISCECEINKESIIS